MAKASVHTDKWTIHQLFEDYFKPKKLVFNTEYQRSEVWPLKKKQKLIDTIIKEYNIGMVFLRGKDGIYEVLDGQQRLKSILHFMENEFKTSAKITPELEEVDFKGLMQDANRYPRFIAFQIDVAFIENADDETTADIFLRLQEGMPLNTAEKLNAMRGKLRNVILKLSQHAVIKKTGIKDHRFAHRLLVGQIFELELKSKFKTMSFADIKFKDLSETYEKYSHEAPPHSVLARVKKYLNFLNKAFDSKASVIRRRGDFIPIYLLYSYLEKNYVTNGIEAEFADFAIEFLSKTEAVNTRDPSTNPDTKPYYDFKVWRSAGALSSRSFRERFKIILGKFLEHKPGLTPKDPKRLFDEGQKLALYYRDKGVCQECKKEVAFTSAEFDHVIPHIHGGPTTVENGQVLCQTCNRQKGAA